MNFFNATHDQLFHIYQWVMTAVGFVNVLCILAVHISVRRHEKKYNKVAGGGR